MPHKPPPSLGVEDKLGEGDSWLILDLLDRTNANSIFEDLLNEVQWNVMHHRGGEVPRQVSVQGEVFEDGSFPVYRHPADESPPLLPFSPTVSRIRKAVEDNLKQQVNHVLIQHYRSGADYISEHSDKTIDVVPGSKIVNVSLGAQRVMTLRTKRDAVPQSGDPRPAQKIPLPHNSMFVMGLETNTKWLHGINHDKRPLHQKSAEEQFADGHRISLTFRNIGTFLSKDEALIYGQGARGKTAGDARPVVNGTEEAAKLLEAFGKENQQSDFDWTSVYGEGSDVLHFTPSEG
ncbi:hypothetical protein BJ138DRAFT_1070243 [Hygrophoropsis aurantiaca]|uniref:Uncharacterized protein n=1 Tax=Hygrophoropsis aurantiaca TaxID=72124 RepID=A0ACB8A2R5_9AGAM|nr:hypothetical protein BJ138DRAFT_1070243 [Hygrophoropsis aurantiaca]